MTEPRRIAYLLARFPALSETFVLNEVIEMVRRNLDISVYSFRKSSRKDRSNLHADSLPRKLNTTTLYHPYVFLGSIWVLLSHPVSVSLLLFKTIFAFINRPLLLIKNLALFPFALLTGWRMQWNRVEHLHVHFASYPAYAAYVINRVFGIPWSMTAHAYDIYMNQRMLKDKIKSATFIVTNSEYNIDFLKRYTAKEEHNKLKLVRTGIVLSKFASVRHITSKVDASILAVGRVEPKKGYGDLIKIVQELAQRGYSINCSIIGHISEEPYIQREYSRIRSLINNSQLEDRISFKEGLSFEDLLEHFAKADIFVLPCVVDENGNSDGLPSVFVEAMAMRIPVVSTRISGIPELIITGHTGWLNEPGDVSGMVNSCLDIIDNPQKASEIADAGRKYVLSQWDIEVTSKQMFDLLVSSDRGIV